MGFLFSTKMPAVQPLPDMPDENDEDVKVAEAAERDRLRRMKGRGSTILTQGLSLGQAPVTKTLLGGGR
jgi:hypothetical protein